MDSELQLQLQLQFQQKEKKCVKNIPLIITSDEKNCELLPIQTKKAIFESLQNFELSLKKLKKLSNKENFEDENENENGNENEGMTDLKSADVAGKEGEDEVEEVATPSPAMQLVLDILKR